MSEETRSAASTVAVTPSDTDDIPQRLGRSPRALWIGGAGDVAVVTPDGSVNTLAGASAGQLIPITVKRVNSTNTDATLIVALY